MGMQLVDWLVVLVYVLFALVVGVVYARRASADVDEYFLSGRTLPWWLAGTSMVATSFACDTPLVVTGWVRDHGIWKNWLWWCFAAGGMLSVFLFSRWWRRGGVMTKAELVELRYSGKEASALRFTLGVFHAGITNTWVLCWVLLAAAKILDVLLGVGKITAVTLACVVSLSYTLMAGFWGVVVTDLVQFAMAMTGAIVLACFAWGALGGSAGLAAAEAQHAFGPDTLRFLPEPGAGSPFDASFWTLPVAALAVYLGVSWWAFEGVDGSGTTVQRIAASRDEREGLLATLWYNVAHYALRPWPWILVALASLALLPTIELASEHPGEVMEVSPARLVIAASDGAGRVEVPLEAGYDEDWRPIASVEAGHVVEAGDVLARTDSERAYVVMMRRLLPAGLLGLVVASLIAAFMSTVDTHVNLAASFFVNDVYRRFLNPNASSARYVWMGRIASVGVLGLAALLAWRSKKISWLYEFFLSFLAGVGPVYVARWLWWRVRASTEIVAMLASSIASTALTFLSVRWPDTPLSPAGVLEPGGRLCVVVLVSGLCALVSMLVTRAPDPASLVGFYRKVRPIGWWGPVRALAPEVEPPREARVALVGAAAALAATYGAMLGVGQLLLGREAAGVASLVVAAFGAAGVAWSLRRLIGSGAVARSPAPSNRSS